MEYQNLWEPERTNQETEQAIRILRWMDERLWPILRDNERYANAYHLRRDVYGYPAMTSRVHLFHGGPLVNTGMHMPVSGDGDESHGHTRVRALLTVVNEAVLDGTINVGIARELMQLLRGNFAAEYRVMERYINASQVGK